MDISMKKIVDLMNSGMKFSGINTVARHSIFCYQKLWTLDTAFVDFTFRGEKPYYETMMFDSDTGEQLECKKAFTKEEAMKNHNEIVAKYKDMLWHGCGIAHSYIKDKDAYLARLVKNIWN